jgi:hypothetical protein
LICPHLLPRLLICLHRRRPLCRPELTDGEDRGQRVAGRLGGPQIDDEFKLLACTTGRSAGFSPLMMRPAAQLLPERFLAAGSFELFQIPPSLRASGSGTA